MGRSSETPNTASRQAEATGPMHPNELAGLQKLMELNARVIPIRSGGKRPIGEGWGDTDLTRNEMESHYAQGGNLGIVLGDASGGLVDVDLDAREVRLLAPAFLPSTGLVSGRRSSPSSHWWYGAVPSQGIKQFIDPGIPAEDSGAMLVELRGKGGQTVVPPSVHASGESIEWEKDGSPNQVSWVDLLASVQWLAVAGLLARVWCEGSRHRLALAVAGWLLHAGHSAATVEHLISQVAQAASDEEAAERTAAVKSTLARMETGQACQGLPTIAEMIGKPRAGALGKWIPSPDGPASKSGTTFPAPQRISEILAASETQVQWLVQGLIEAGEKVFIAAYSKTHKTNMALELAVAVATGTPFLGKFAAPSRGRVGLVMMEDSPRHVAHRLRRLALEGGRNLRDVEDSVHVWSRPPLTLTDPRSMSALREWIDELELDAIVVDNFSLVGTGNSNSSDEVTPQLAAFSDLGRNRPGLVTVMIHHGKKVGADGGGRMTDMVRGSGAFTAWYSCGFFLSRKTETAPINVLVELRNMPSPRPFMFDVTDQHPGDPENGVAPSGSLRLSIVGNGHKNSRTAEREAELLDYLRDNPGCSKTNLRKGVGGKGAEVDRVFEGLCRDGRARVEAPIKQGLQCKCYALDEEGIDDDTPSF